MKVRAALVVGVVEALLLVALAFAQFEAAVSLGSDLDPLADPLVSDLGRIAVVLWLLGSAVIGVLVAKARGRAFHAAGLAFGAVAFAVIASPVLEQLASSGQAPRAPYLFVPPGGSTPNSAYLPLLIPLAIVVGGGLAAIEAALAARLTRSRYP